MKSVITLLVEHKAPIPDLADKVAQRSYNLDKVENVTVIGVASSVDLIALPVVEMAEEVKA